MIYKNAQENKHGTINCLIFFSDKWVPHTQDPLVEYELSEELGPEDWSDIKPCPQSEKDAHEAKQARATFKEERTAAVQSLTITTQAGNEFDADETSQTRMARAISVMSDTDTNIWVLTDNTQIQVSKSDLIEALTLAGQAQSALWVQS